jgi:uncharacterized protein YfaS (alpha-2-macroglobulin family)
LARKLLMPECLSLRAAVNRGGSMIERSYGAMLGWGMCLATAALGCSNSGSDKGPGAGPRDVVTTPEGRSRTDLPSNGAVEVDEAGLHAVARDGLLELSIPVRGLKSGTGTVFAEVIAVDGSKVEASVEVGYELERDEQKVLTTQLGLPKELKQQADRVAYSVRVHDSASSLRVTRSLLYVLSPYELRLEGPSALQADKPGSYRVRAQNPLTRAPVIDQAVTLDLKRGDETLRTLTGSTDESGSSIFAINVEESGAYSLAVTGGEDALSGSINVRDAGQKLLLTTDKPIYQPGQTIHLRAMALENPDNTPLAGTSLVFEVSDGKGNKVFKKTRTADDYGIASVDFKLANLVNMGSYKLQVSGPVKTEKTVEVSRYVLPKFEVRVATDRTWYAPGDEITGTTDGRYFFGKNVNGADVSIEALTLDAGSQVFQRVMGKTDDQGHFAFAIKLPEVLAGIPLQDGNALVTLRTRVTDTAGQIVEKDTAITVAASGIRLSLVPEATEVVPGLENRFHLFATDPLGAPIADAELKLSGGAPDMSARTDAFGHAELRWAIANSARVKVELTTHEGVTANAEFDFAAQSGDEHVLVRTDKSLYALGETVKVQVLGTRRENRAYVDWLNDGQAVDMRTVELKDGVASFEVALDSGLAGSNRIEAYVVDDGGNVVRAGRTIVVKHEGGLKVALSQDKSEYRPGDPAKLTFSVTDEQGKPAPAALGVQIVDEAVFGLIDARPGLLRTFFELEDSFVMPQYEIHAPPVNFEKLVFEDAVAQDPDQKRAAQAQAEAQLSALRGQRMIGLSLGSWDDTLIRAQTKLNPFVEKERKRVIDALTALAKSTVSELAAAGCKPEQYYCSAQGSDFTTVFANAVLPKIELIDFWGSKYAGSSTGNFGLVFTSAGADERRGNADDTPVTITLSELGVSSSIGTPAFAPGGVAFGGAAAAGAAAGAPQPLAATPPAAMAPADGHSTSAEGDASPRVRSEFPETMYVNPALITDADGKAIVTLDMADSITSWRVSTLANARGGALGGGQAAIRVFQDFFVDIGFPAELTRGDQVEFPVVVYNYLKDAQTVRLELEAGNWFTALGPTTTSVTLGPDQVKSVTIPVRVDRVGAQTLTVRAFGTSASDAIARSVRVVPDGVPVQRAQSGSLQQAGTTLSVSVPSNAIAGSALLYLDVYPAFMSQAVQGLDSMLQVPYGCFEQTTSTTWPNVLVTSYLEQTKQNTPEIQLKAESLISAGYQRLLTFEHASGGFSWFGESDQQADVSVTAFGLMEFADMAKVSEVDPAMIMRTQTWLAAQQAGDGSFAGGMTEFFSFQTSALRNTAFTVWALADSGYTGSALDAGLDYIRTQSDQSATDTYTLALAANALAAAAPNDAKLTELLDRLDAKKVEDGSKAHWASDTAQTSFYSAGTDSDVSTTALIAHAFIRTSSHAAAANSALEYIVGAKDVSGNFGSTQASIWSLKALMLAASRGTDGAVGDLTVSVDGAEFTKLSLVKEQSDVNTRVDMSSLAVTGSHTVSLGFAGTGQVSYNLVSSHHVPWAVAPRPLNGPLSISVSYDRTSLVVDETVAATLSVNNLTASTQNMLLVTVGIPPGFELQTEDLDAYVASGTISRYERTAKQLIVYLTRLGPIAKTELKYRLKASMPVRAADGGSQVSLYYQPEQRAASASTLLVVTGS